MDKKKYYKRIFGYFKGEEKGIFVYIITSILIVAISTLSPAVSAKTLKAITDTELKSMVIFSLITALLFMSESLIQFINRHYSRKIESDVAIRIKENVSTEMFDLEMKNFDKEGTGFFSNRIENEPYVLAGIFSRIRYSFTELLSSLGILIYIFIVCPIIGIFLVLSSSISFFINQKRLKRWEKENTKRNEMREKYSSNFGELIRGIKDIKVLNLKDYLIKKTTKEQKKINQYEFSIHEKDEKSYLLVDNLKYIIDFLFIILGVYLIKNDMLSGSTFLVLYMYKGNASYFMMEINGFLRNYKMYNTSLERLYEIVDGLKYPKEKFGDKSIDEVKGELEFKNVSFSYGEKETLKDVSFKVNSCETIGIVGKSGAGKSTMFNLINKLYDVEEGEIDLDGIPLSELDEKSIRENITTITQNPYIFNMSIKENLKIVNPDVTDEKIEEICKLCALDEYLSSLEKGIDTVVGENGVILSGGLKQRVAIARAILKNSKIILLDEATSSLDNETQDFIHHSLKKIRKDYTILIIAHRLSTVIDCDRIIVIEDGKVVGFDKHENLIKNNRTYKKLYKKELA